MEKDRYITFIISATIVLAIKFLVYGKFICVSNLPIALTIIIFVVILIGVIYNKAGNENEFSLKEEDDEKQDESEKLIDLIMFGPDEKEEREFRKNNPYVKEQKAKEAEAEKQLFDKFRILADCPCTFFGLNMADEIEKTYHEALERGKKEGFVPIIVFISDILYDEIMKEFNIVTGEEISINYINSKRKELIDIALDSEGKKWLENTLQKKWNEYGGSYRYNELLGKPSNQGYELHDLCLDDYNSSDAAILAEIPVSEPWQALAWFPFGGWNDCPSKKAFVSVSKYWFNQYGAAPAFITYNTIEMTAPQPVEGTQSLHLAKEQHSFCPDILAQTGLSTINDLADSLRKSTVWHFWWN